MPDVVRAPHATNANMPGITQAAGALLTTNRPTIIFTIRMGNITIEKPNE
jgi:hypothetical protein